MEFQLADLFEALADAAPDHECLIAGEVRHTRGSLDEAANRVANLLADRGVGAGDNVGLYSRNRAEFIEVMVGCWKLGAVPVNINYRYVADELRYIIDDGDLVAMVIEAEYLPTLAPLAPEFPGLATILVLDDGAPTSVEGLATIDYAEALAGASPARPAGAVRSADDLYLLYTGGTTGMPKGVMWRHEDIFFAAFGGGNYLAPITRPDDIVSAGADAGMPMRVLALAPLMHGGGQWISFIGILSGGTAIVNCAHHFDPHHILGLIEAERPNSMAMVGDAMARPIAEAMLDPASSYDCSSLFSVGNGGAMLSPGVRAQLVEAFPHAMITDSYGATETGGVGSQVEQEGYQEGPKFTVGPDTTVLDPDTLEPVQPGERGMLARRGHIPLGYRNDPDKTAATYRTDARGVRWVVPGDWATLDDAGRIVLFGRGSVSINSGGEKIYPEEVEAAVRSHPGVYDAIVVGVPDERWGQKVVALVQPRADIEPPDLASIQEHCRAHIAGYKVPREIVVGPVRRTNVGKADYVWAATHAREALGIG